MATKVGGRPLRVAVLGGGMGGLACAHELAREGVEVTIHEAGHALGGKARSHYVPGTGTNGRRDLPGEHGFRFYPAFYRHVVATMEEIPDALSPTGRVAGNLVGTGEAGIATPARGVVASPRRPKSLRDGLRSIGSVYASGGTVRDLARYLGAHLKYLSACDARREREIEAIPWSRFIGAEDPGFYREEFRRVLLACTRTMVAMDAERGSSRTVGQASCLLLLDAFGDAEVDRTMTGPTTECWIEPWQAHLASQGVRFRFGERVMRLDLEHGRIARAWVASEGETPRAIDADAYVLAVPIEAAMKLLGPELREADEALERLASIDVEATTTWMVGAQYFLSEDVPLCEGHLFLPESPWSLTVISQAQFWNRGRRSMSTYGDGRLRGILSVDVSSCFTPDEDGVRLVDETSREGILRRVLRQLLASLDPATARAIERAVYAPKLDDELTVGPRGVVNAGRLLVHPPGSRAMRPTAVLGIPNLYLAADYVHTSMDLASMEGANEAGRLAARGVLERAGLDAASVETFAFDELGRLERLRAVDAWLHARGLPHLMDVQGHVRRLTGGWAPAGRGSGTDPAAARA